MRLFDVKLHYEMKQETVKTMQIIQKELFPAPLIF